MTRFPIGFWNYMTIADQGPEAVQEWADAGMTLAMGPSYGPDEDELRKMRTILDAAAARDISVILCDRRADWRHLTKYGEEAYRRDMQEAVRQIGEHPAIAGFHVGDEPDKAAFVDACRAHRIQKELAPGLTPFLNLLQWNLNVHRWVGFERWEDYLDEYMRYSAADVLAYDCYSQMLPGEVGWDMYFRNLRMFQAAAARHGVPFWPTQLAVGHWHYRCPSEEDLRWQLNTAVAHGAKGILWFFFYMRRPHDNFRLSPIDEHGRRTPTFDALARVCNSFLKGPAATIMDLTLRRVHHLGKVWGGVEALDTSAGPVGRVTAAWMGQGTPANPEFRTTAAPLIVSQFTDSRGRDHIMLVNNSLQHNAWAFCSIRCLQATIVKIGWQGREPIVARSEGDKDTVTIDHWLAPGQMELFRVDEPTTDSESREQ